MIARTIPNNLHDYFNRIYWPRQIRSTPATLKLYSHTLRRFDEFLQRPALLDDLDDDTLCGFLKWRIDAGKSSLSVSGERDKILAMARFAAKKRHVEEFPDVPTIEKIYPQPIAATKLEVARLMASASMSRGLIGRAPAGWWWQAFYAVAFATGERTGAMLQLRWDWLRPDGYLPVPAMARKGRKAELHFLPPFVVQCVERLRGLTDDLIFAKPFKIGAFYSRTKTIRKRAGLPVTREWQPQVCRRTFASWCEASGGNATEALQHTSRAVTRRSYLDPTIARRAPASIPVAAALGLDKCQ